MKLSTPVTIDAPQRPFSLSDKIMLLGSCFVDNMGAKFAAAGFEVCTNPFGTLYNPASLLAAVERLDSGEPFGLSDCVEMGAGAGRICSFSHHTSFARPTAEEFLEHANSELGKAREFWRSADRVILTLGTSLVWYHDGRAVANCLKRPAAEFERKMLSVSQISEALQAMIEAHPEKRFTITVSPIRHLGDGARINTLSKARLLLAAAAVADPAEASENHATLGCVRGGTASEAKRWGPKDVSGGLLPRSAAAAVAADYFPSYEIMMDELRDYRFYADDLVHPSSAAVQYIWERFLETFVSPSDLQKITENEKAARIASHRPNLK